MKRTESRLGLEFGEWETGCMTTWGVLRTGTAQLLVIETKSTSPRAQSCIALRSAVLLIILQWIRFMFFLLMGSGHYGSYIVHDLFSLLLERSWNRLLQHNIHDKRPRCHLENEKFESPDI